MACRTIVKLQLYVDDSLNGQLQSMCPVLRMGKAFVKRAQGWRRSRPVTGWRVTFGAEQDRVRVHIIWRKPSQAAVLRAVI